MRQALEATGIFRAAFDAAPNAHIVFEASGLVVVSNKKAQRVFGYHQEELEGKPLQLLLFQEIEEHLHFHEGVEKTIEMVAKRKNGSTFLAAITLSPLLVDDQTLISATIQDISEQKRLHDELVMTNDQFKGAFEHSAIGMALVSLDGTWLKVNRQLCLALGYTEKEFLLKTFQELTHPEDLDLDLKHVQEILLGQIQHYQMEKRYFHKKGHIIWVHLSVSLVRDIEGRPVHFVSQIKDITQRKHTEALLKESDALFQKLSKQTPGMVYKYRIQPNGKGSFPFISEGIWELYELLPHQVKQDATLIDLYLHEEDKQVLFDSVQESYQTLRPWELEYRIVLPKKGLRWMKASANPEKLADGTVEWFGCIIDITLLKEKEAELTKSLVIIGEQNKRLLNFAHIVSHNLRSHSGNIHTMLEFIDQEKSPEKAKTMFTHLKSTSAALKETIKHLNDVVSIQTHLHMPKEKINLRNYVTNIEQVLRGEITQKQVTVLNKIPFDLLIHYNPAYMESILLNFFSNAIKYAHPKRKAIITFMLEQENEKNYLLISDNGSGIDLKTYGEHLFGMYKTFHGNEDAKGIGLFITKNQIEAMGGQVEVQSEVNKGTTFKIYIQ